MTAALWAVASGVGFGVFQSLNRRALLDIEDPYVSTFVNLVIACLALLAVAVATEDVTRLFDAGYREIEILPDGTLRETTGLNGAGEEAVTRSLKTERTWY